MILRGSRRICRQESIVVNAAFEMEWVQVAEHRKSCWSCRVVWMALLTGLQMRTLHGTR